MEFSIGWNHHHIEVQEDQGDRIDITTYVHFTLAWRFDRFPTVLFLALLVSPRL